MRFLPRVARDTVQLLLALLWHLFVKRLGWFGGGGRKDDYLKKVQSKARTYAEWAAAGKRRDELNPAARTWKEDESDNLFDAKLLRERKERLNFLLLEKGDQSAKRLAKELATCLRRSLGRVSNVELYDGRHCAFGTKLVVGEYNGTVCCAIEAVAAARQQLSCEEREMFLRNTRQSYGGSALLLSGGASLGMYHLGVVRALFERGCLPRVISGSSIGSVVSALIGVRSDAELAQLFADIEAERVDFGDPFDTRGSAMRKVKRCLQKGVLMDIKKLEQVIRSQVGDVTFLEAYQRTGRIINMTVTPDGASKEAIPILLNYLTSPDVLIWSASSASCALPFLYESQELMCKDPLDGSIRSYHSSTTRWSDGSASADLPMRRLAELFNVNQFIVSQVNPHMLLLLSPTNTQGWMAKVKFIIRTELRHRVTQLSHLGWLPGFLSWMAPAFVQPFAGDITIVPSVQIRHLPLLFANPTAKSLRMFVQQGYVGCFPMVEMIHDRTEIERTLERCIESVVAEAKSVDPGHRRARMMHSTAFLALTDNLGDDGH